MRGWKNEPLLLKDWPNHIDCILSIDENGITNMKNVIRPPNNLHQWFTTTGVMLNKEDFQHTKSRFVHLKENHWEDGLFNKRRVVLHSRDIRKKIGAFNPRHINYKQFKAELNSLLSELDYTIYTSSIDKFAHARKYVNPYSVYDLCLEFILERFSHELRKDNKSGIILLESRGKKENKLLLSTAVKLLEYGNRFYSPGDFKCIKGIYFNPKRTRDKKLSFIQLELADLVSYPIHKFIRDSEVTDDFTSIASKIYNYPEYFGYGMKLFP